MAKYTGSYAGSWAKGFASTFSQAPSMIFQALQWKEKKKEKEKIDKAAEEFKINIANFANKIDETFKDGTVTQQEYSDMVGFGTILGSEYLKEWEDLYKNYTDMSSQEIDSQLDTINNTFDKWKTLGMGDSEAFMGVLDDIGKSTKYPKVKTQVNYLKNMINNRGQQPEGFNSPEELLKVHPGADWEFNSSLKKYIVKQITGPKILGISDYNSAASYLSKFVNAPPETFNKVLAGLQNKFPDIDMSDITQESLREPETETKTRITSLPELEKYRDKALDTNTWEDAQPIINRYIEAGYDPAEMPNKQDWIDAKLKQLDDHLEMLKEITDENGQLKGSQTFKFLSGDEEETQTGEAWYKDIYDAYTFYLEELRKMGVDVSKYRKIKPPGETKVGFLKGMFTPKLSGGYQSIYY